MQVSLIVSLLTIDTKAEAFGDDANRQRPGRKQTETCNREYLNTSTMSTLAAAYAEAGRFAEAVATAEKACVMAENGERGILAGNRQMLEYYRNNRPFHQPKGRWRRWLVAPHLKIGGSFGNLSQLKRIFSFEA